MRILQRTKDGGSKSTVDAYFLIEIKNLFSVALLKFNKGSRENFHSHAFNAVTWFISGDIEEESKDGSFYKYSRSLVPKLTPKEKTHRVVAHETSWCLTIRGPWSSVWTEYNSATGNTYYLTHGREVLGYEKNSEESSNEDPVQDEGSKGQDKV